MGSTSLALPSDSSTFAPVTFTGVSTYSSDLQQVLSRAVAIATLPVQQLQNDQADIEGKVQALAALNPAVAAVGSDITALGTLASSQALSASSSDPSLVAATATGATSSASHTISNITSLASAASASSAASYPDVTSTPVSADGNLQLVAGSQTYNITLNSSQNNLSGLANAINSISGGPVTASVLTTSQGDYLSISANSNGQLSQLQLNDLPSGGGSTNLLNTSGPGLNLGSNANFDLDGISISQPDNTVNNVIPGLTFTIEGTTSPGQNVTVSLSPQASNISSALQTFVSDYNTLLTQVNGQMGQSGGALNGNSIMYQIESAMQQAVTYEGGSGGVQNLSNLGISLDDTGTMSFDPTALSSMNSAQLSNALSFLGSSTTGFGALAASFTQISDPISGMIQSAEASYNQTDQELQTQVDSMNARITTMQTNLQLQLSQADTAIASLQSQQQVISASVQAVDLSLFGQNFGSASANGG